VDRVGFVRGRAVALVVCGILASAALASAQATLLYEAESLPRTSSGASTAVQVDSAASGGQWVLLNGNSVGDHMDLKLSGVPAGAYKVSLRFKANFNRGMVNLLVDGTQLGPGLNQESPPFFTDWFAGRVNFPTDGDHVIRVAVLGRSSTATSYQLSADAFIFEPSAPPAPTVVVEAENASPVGSGASASTAAVSGASGGVLQFLNGDGIGDSLTLTTPVLDAGPYLVKFRYRTNTTRAKHRFTLAGMDLATIDQYAPSPGFVEVTLPYLVMDIPAALTLQLTVTGKNGASSGHIISADSFTFVGQ